MSLTEFTTRQIAGPDDRNQSLLGLMALVGECSDEGIPVERLFVGTGLDPDQLGDPAARMSHRQRLAIYANAAQHAQRAEIALLAGSRQRISDYGFYGYALSSSATLHDAVMFGASHLTLAGPAFQISYRLDRNSAVLRSENASSLGDLLPFAAEFWRSSIVTLMSRVLEAPLPSRRMLFSYPAPPYWRLYEQTFNCPVEFDAGAMEWHLDASAMDRRCPNANPLTAQLCMDLCEQMMAQMAVETGLVQRIRAECGDMSDGIPTADDMARRLRVSVRTLFRRLSAEGTSYQAILDGLRRDLSVERLTNSKMSVEDIAAHVGFSEAANFRKAFRRWTGETPGHYRLKAGTPQGRKAALQEAD